MVTEQKETETVATLQAAEVRSPETQFVTSFLDLFLDYFKKPNN